MPTLLGKPLNDIFRTSLSRRIVTLILVYSSVITLFATGYQLYVDYRGDLDQLMARFQQIEASYKRSLEADLWNLDTDQVRVHMDGILTLPDIQQVKIESEAMSPIIAGEEVRQHAVTHRLKLYHHTDERRELIGEMLITASLRGIFERLERKAILVLISQTIKTFLVTMFMLFIFNHFVFRHLEKMAGFARAMDFSNLGRELKLERRQATSGADELDVLVDAVNAMQHKLKSSFENILEQSKELEEHRDHLEELVEERTHKLKEAQKNLIEVAHNAGRAEVIIGLMHNIGNVLNTINVSVQLGLYQLDHSKSGRLKAFTTALHNNRNRLIDYLSEEGRIDKTIEYLEALEKALLNEQQELRNELKTINEHVHLARESISAQRQYARAASIHEELDVEELIAAILLSESVALETNSIQVTEDYAYHPKVWSARTRLSHVLMNLIHNSIEALMCNAPGNRSLRVGTYQWEDEGIRIEIEDNGEGIAKKDLQSIFNYGFTTKPDNHGFGLHSCANALSELGGRIEAQSDGPGTGATLIVYLPCEKTKKENRQKEK